MALTEIPEIFGAEGEFLPRCIDRATCDKAVRLINNFREYFIAHGEPVSENPSPGNRKGGITTLEEKSLGCVQKGGRAPIVDILDYGETIKSPGLSILNGPGKRYHRGHQILPQPERILSSLPPDVGPRWVHRYRASRWRPTPLWRAEKSNWDRLQCRSSSGRNRYARSRKGSTGSDN